MKSIITGVFLLYWDQYVQLQLVAIPQGGKNCMSAEQDDQEHIHIDVLVCPLCGEANRCSYAAGHPHSECWCNRATFPEGVFDRIPPEQRRKSCICQRCLDEYADKSQQKEEPHS
ncbi:cysteine-rich CWC family protein [Paenibacillus polymyxa]